MTSVLVTGGAGVIGSSTVRELKRRGYQVIVLDDLSSGHKENLPGDVHFVRGSVVSDEDLRRCFSLKPEYVLHMAALFANQNSVEHPAEDLMVSGLGTLRVLENCRLHDVSKFLFVSSSSIYGQQEVIEEDSQEYRPGTPYAITKVLAERYSRFWADYHGINSVIVRLFNAYGPGEYPGRYRNVIPNFLKLAMEGKPLQITGDGSEARDFTYVDDTVAGILGALFTETTPGDVFNIATGRETTILDLAKMINGLCQNPSEIQFLPKRKWDCVSRRRVSIAKASRRFGYLPRVDLRTGLARTYEWLKTVKV